MDNLGTGFTVICGPMKSGKTRHLLVLIDRAKISGSKHLVFKPTVDTSCCNSISSRYLKNSIEALEVKDPALIYEKAKEAGFEKLMIFIDELQFFPKSISKWIGKLLNEGVVVLAAGLDLDGHLKTFGVMGDALAMATRVIKLSAICERCQDTATVTATKVANSVKQEENLFLIEGKDETTTYETLCRQCYVNKQL